jgi:alginate O-acetyltransferase complex protein AlgI
MDATSFLAVGKGGISEQNVAEHPRPVALPWLAAGACLCFGSALILDAAWRAGVASDLLAGWEGMVGVVLVLHFGVFKVLSLLWEMHGVRAEPLMRAPLLSNSLAEFWGSRWNSAFNNLVHQVAFVPLARNIGGPPALLLVFVISGCVHELVISVPARGGFGLPTLYFLAQGTALLVERSQWGRRRGLGRGTIGRSFMLAVVAAPLFWLFHPLFVSRVIVPMLKAIGPI